MVEDFEPTLAEKLMVWRRRSGKTQVALAQALGIPLHVYGDLERGKLQMDRSLLATLGEVELNEQEKLTALRRRLGITQRIAAAELGVCRMTAAAMEEGKADAAPLWELLKARAA
jgi:DNA-binding XRE family transcriptional regulator